MTTSKSPIILMYHGIVGHFPRIPRGREEGAEIYDLDYRKFQEQMNYLKENGYKVVTLETMKGEDKEVIITFDDGEMNNFDEAFVILKKLGFPAYFFLVANRIDRSAYLGEVQIMAMYLAGMKFGSHGLTHAILTELTDVDLKKELVESKNGIEKVLGKSIDTISIPRGFCSDKVIEEARKAGYKTVFISEKSQQVTLPCYPRIAVKSHWTLERFIQALHGEKPTSEKLTDNLKSAVKSIFGDKGYNNLRKLLVRKSS